MFNFIYPLGKDRKWERERLKRLKKKRKGKTEIKEKGEVDKRRKKGIGQRKKVNGTTEESKVT